jgi:hypothetical protein
MAAIGLGGSPVLSLGFGTIRQMTRRAEGLSSEAWGATEKLGRQRESGYSKVR